MKFTFSIALHEHILEDEKKHLETFCGEIEADSFNKAKGRAWVEIQERVQQIYRETGMHVGCGQLELVYQKPTQETAQETPTSLPDALEALQKILTQVQALPQVSHSRTSWEEHLARMQFFQEMLRLRLQAYAVTLRFAPEEVLTLIDEIWLISQEKIAEREPDE